MESNSKAKFKKKRRYPKHNSKPREVIEKSCGVLLFRTEGPIREYLLLHYPSGHWDFAKGHVEKKDKSEKETALRELEEETGITDVELFEGFRHPIYYEFNRGRRELVKKTVIYFLAEAKHIDVKISFEHQDFIWLPYTQALEKLTFENARELLRQGEAIMLAHTQ